MNFTDTSIVLTGASGGIGSAVARALADEGARLLLTDVRESGLIQTARDCERSGADIALLAANLTERAGRTELVDCAEQRAADVLINIAGINPFGLFEEQTDAEIERAIEINAVAPMLLCRAMLPALARRPSAHIVNVGSAFGSIGYPGFCAYSASKFAVHGFTEALRRELGDTSIAVHYIAPRATRTALYTDRIAAMNRMLGVGMDTPDQVAAEIVGALRDGRRERFIGWSERISARLNGFAPGLVDWFIAKQLPTVRRFAAREFVTEPHGGEVPTHYRGVES
jgi:short-subunit dehydrogenase